MNYSTIVIYMMQNGSIYKLEHVNTILSIFSVFTDIIGFHSAYIDELWDDYGDNLHDLVYEIELDYLCLAACKIKISSKLAPNFEAFRHYWNQLYKQKLVELKAAAVAEKVPLREEE